MPGKQDNLFEAAIGCTVMGWLIFPLRPRGKSPLIPHGFKEATCDPNIIQNWWEQYPNANIGLGWGQSG